MRSGEYCQQKQTKLGERTTRKQLNSLLWLYILTQKRLVTTKFKRTYTLFSPLVNIYRDRHCARPWRHGDEKMYFLFSRSLNPWEINVQINSKIIALGGGPTAPTAVLSLSPASQANTLYEETPSLKESTVQVIGSHSEESWISLDIMQHFEFRHDCCIQNGQEVIWFSNIFWKDWRFLCKDSLTTDCWPPSIQDMGTPS